MGIPYPQAMELDLGSIEDLLAIREEWTATLAAKAK